MKKYIVEFVELNGNVYEFEFLTDDIELEVESKCYLDRITSYLFVYHNYFSYIN